MIRGPATSERHLHRSRWCTHSIHSSTVLITSNSPFCRPGRFLCSSSPKILKDQLLDSSKLPAVMDLLHLLKGIFQRSASSVDPKPLRILGLLSWVQTLFLLNVSTNRLSSANRLLLRIRVLIGGSEEIRTSLCVLWRIFDFSDENSNSGPLRERVSHFGLQIRLPFWITEYYLYWLLRLELFF